MPSPSEYKRSIIKRGGRERKTAGRTSERDENKKGVKLTHEKRGALLRGFFEGKG